MLKFSKLFVLFLLSASAFAQASETLPNKFDSKGNPKAKGVWFSLKYPNGWRAMDAERPNIVKKFIRDNGSIVDTIAVQVVNLTPEQAKGYSSASAEQWSNAKCDFYKDAEVTNVKETKLEGEKAFLCDAKVTVERAGQQAHQANQLLTILYKEKVINIICSAVTLNAPKEQLNRAFEKLKPTCSSVFNSFVILDKYSK